MHKAKQFLAVAVIVLLMLYVNTFKATTLDGVENTNSTTVEFYPEDSHKQCWIDLTNCPDGE